MLHTVWLSDGGIEEYGIKDGVVTRLVRRPVQLPAVHAASSSL